ncbi:MAG: hypothetical protein ABI863_22435 [Ginsengibacter sp.]
MNENAERIINACNNNFEANKGECNRFAIAVAKEFNIVLSGIADNIVDEIQTDEWIKLNDGIDAKNKADKGFFVIGGLKAADEIPPAVHGHIVVVLSGDLAHDKYPTAMWGSLGGPLPSPGKNTINFSWNKTSRDKVIYAARQI